MSVVGMRYVLIDREQVEANFEVGVELGGSHTWKGYGSNKGEEHYYWKGPLSPKEWCSWSVRGIPLRNRQMEDKGHGDSLGYSLFALQPLEQACQRPCRDWLTHCVDPELKGYRAPANWNTWREVDGECLTNHKAQALEFAKSNWENSRGRRLAPHINPPDEGARFCRRRTRTETSTLRVSYFLTPGSGRSGRRQILMLSESWRKRSVN